MSVTQLSVFVENRPGRLSEITSILGSSQINIRAVSIADTKDFGIMRIIVDYTEKAKQVLKQHNCLVTLTKVIAVEIADKPCAMANVMEVLYGEDISVEYMYAAFLNVSQNTACLILRVDDNEKAQKALTENGFKLLDQEQLL